jgi:hypothetical protein
VLAQRQVERLHLLQPVAQGLLQGRPGDHRQGVDEQADLRLDTGSCAGRPATVAPKATQSWPAALQQQQPGRLDQGVDGDFLLPQRRPGARPRPHRWLGRSRRGWPVPPLAAAGSAWARRVGVSSAASWSRQNASLAAMSC